MFRMILALTLLALPGVAHAEWYEASSGHFVVYSEDRPERIKEFTTNLERFAKSLRFLRGMSDAPIGNANRVTVYVLDDVDDVARLAGGGAVAGFYAPRAGRSVAFVPRKAGAGGKLDLGPMAILLHEYTHHFLLSLSPDTAYPAWFVEGYAEFFAASSFEPDGAVTFGRPPLYRAWGLNSPYTLLPMEKLLAADSLKLNSEQREGLYGRGWLLTHYLFLGGKREGQLGAYLKALNSGATPAVAAKTFGDPRVLDTELNRYMRGKLIAKRIPASALPIGEVTLRKLNPAESATIEVRIRSDGGVNSKTAPIVYAAARKACEPYPNDPAAQLVLTEAAFDAGDYAAAEAAADRVLAANPRSVDALLYKAQARAEVAVKAKDKTPATWTGIRRLISSANRIDPENPQPLRDYFLTYMLSGATPPKIAREGLYYAYLLAPQDRGLRFLTAQSYLQEHDAPKARALLMTLAYDPHSSGLGAVAARLIAAIDAGHADTALEDLEKQIEEGAKPKGD